MHSEITFRAPAQPGINVDRWMYVSMAGLFALTAFVGFGPRSAAILEGQLPNPPLTVHIHAALMVAWLLLTLVQSSLAATGKRVWHMTLGMASLPLVALMVLFMFLATFDTYALMATAGAVDMASNILLLQVRSVILFPLFFLWALLSHKEVRDTHKRMMVLCTFVLIDAAVARMDWLPGNNIAQTYAFTFFYQFLLLLPVVLYDLWKLGTVHSAYWKGIALYLPFVLATCLLWNNPWWLELAPRLMNV